MPGLAARNALIRSTACRKMAGSPRSADASARDRPHAAVHRAATLHANASQNEPGVRRDRCASSSAAVTAARKAASTTLSNSRFCPQAVAPPIARALAPACTLLRGAARKRAKNRVPGSEAPLLVLVKLVVIVTRHAAVMLSGTTTGRPTRFPVPSLHGKVRWPEVPSA